MDDSFDNLVVDNSFERKIPSACLPSAFYGGKGGDGGGGRRGEGGDGGGGRRRRLLNCNKKIRN